MTGGDGGQPDSFFTAEQQRRLAYLMDRWRRARDASGALPAAEQQELDALVEAELVASGQWVAASASASGR